MIFVYRNLNRKGVVWSVKSKNTGRVVARSECVMIKNATLKVSQAGRKRVLKERRRNVHAGIEGTWVRGEWEQHLHDYRGMDSIFNKDGSPHVWTKVYYNPYKHESFVRCDNGRPIHFASRVILDNNGCWMVE